MTAHVSHNRNRNFGNSRAPKKSKSQNPA